jgi:hypothetical protein
MYKVGEVYVWQNQSGINAYLNGTECAVTQGPDPFFCETEKKIVDGWDTDSPLPPGVSSDLVMVAFEGDLRPKEPPSGEKSILNLFKQPMLEPA